MKRIIIISIPFLLAIMFYLIASFITWESNPAKWETATRGGISFIWLVFSVLGCGCANDLIKSN